METQTDTPRVWIGDLAAYNAGELVGEWIDATDRDALAAAVDRYGHGGRSDTFVADHEGFGGWPVGEYPDFDDLADLADMIEEHGADMVGAFQDVTGCGVGDLADLPGRFVGTFDGWTSFAMSDVNTWTDGDTTHIGTALGTMTVTGTDAYVDWEGIGRDYRLDGCAYIGSERGGELYVFTAV